MPHVIACYGSDVESIRLNQHSIYGKVSPVFFCNERNLLIAEQKDNLLSEWKISYVTSFPGEHIIKGIFFHNGRKINLISEKKDQQHSYFDKFQKLKFLPSVRHFG